MKRNFLLHILFCCVLLFNVSVSVFGQDKNIVYVTNYSYTSDSLDNFTGELRYYKYEKFPELRYLRPDVNDWVNDLEEINDICEPEKHIAAGFISGKVKYIRIITDPATFSKEFYTICKDTVKLEKSGLIVSAPNYSVYIYKYNLLAETMQYFACSKGKTDNSQIEFCLYKKETIGYFKGTFTPKRIKTEYINKFSGNERNTVLEYDTSGNQIKKVFVD